MKTKKISEKLALRKETITTLGKNEINVIKGAAEGPPAITMVLTCAGKGCPIVWEFPPFIPPTNEP